MRRGSIGHNVAGIDITVEARLFNSLARYRGPQGLCRALTLAADSTVGDLMARLALPEREVFLVLRNGRDITRSLHGPLNVEAALEDGDVIAFSGPVPYSWGYGAPVV